MSWHKAFVFSKKNHAYLFSKRDLVYSNEYLHLYVPWSDSHLNEGMFRLKKQIEKNKKAYIPLMDSDLTPSDISNDEKEKIKFQILENIETHLIMSNSDCIHLFKVKDLVDSSCVSLSTLDEFKQHNYNLWIEVEDLFVFKTNHVEQHRKIIEEELHKLCERSLNSDIFTPFWDGEDERSYWVDSHRSLTFDYYVKSCELQQNVFRSAWEYLSFSSKHYLVKSQQSKSRALLTQGEEKFHKLEQSLNEYVVALQNELHDIYLKSLIDVYKSHESLQICCNDFFKNNSKLPNAFYNIKEILEGRKKSFFTLGEYIDFFEQAKSLYFSLKIKFTKQISKQEFLNLEIFLERQEGLVDFYHCQGLRDKIQSIIDLNQWVKGFDSKQLSSNELNQLNIKLSYVLNELESNDPEDNIFLKLLELKAGKSFLKKDLGKELEDLISRQTKLAA